MIVDAINRRGRSIKCRVSVSPWRTERSYYYDGRNGDVGLVEVYLPRTAHCPLNIALLNISQ
jgi:hypothetical protein